MSMALSAFSMQYWLPVANLLVTSPLHAGRGPVQLFYITTTAMALQGNLQTTVTVLLCCGILTGHDAVYSAYPWSSGQPPLCCLHCCISCKSK
jgi:hypothetical protein